MLPWTTGIQFIGMDPDQYKLALHYNTGLFWEGKEATPTFHQCTFLLQVEFFISLSACLDCRPHGSGGETVTLVIAFPFVDLQFWHTHFP